MWKCCQYQCQFPIRLRICHGGKLGIGNIGTGNTCTLATLNKMFARAVANETKGAGE